MFLTIRVDYILQLLDEYRQILTFNITSGNGEWHVNSLQCELYMSSVSKNFHQGGSSN